MSRAIALGVVVLLALACVAAYGSIAPPQVTSPPIFAANGEAKAVYAIVAGSPTDVVLSWDAGGITGKDAMEEVEPCIYAGSISGDAVKGALTYKVTAFYADGALESQDYTLTAVPAIAKVKAQPAGVSRKVIVSRPWGTGVGTFGFSAEAEGASTIPAAIALNSVGVNVLDTANKRVLTFDKAGKLLKKVDVPTATACDVVADGAGLVVIDQLNSTVYKVLGNRVSAQAVDLKGLAFGTKFAIDPSSKTLLGRDAAQGALVSLANGSKTAASVVVEVKANTVLVGVGADVVAIDLGAKVLDAAEVVTDGKGIVWMLVGVVDGDGVAFKLVSLDPVKKAAKAASIQTYIPGDCTRRMVGADSGVLLFEGDSEAGRIVSFEPAGGEF